MTLLLDILIFGYSSFVHWRLVNAEFSCEYGSDLVVRRSLAWKET